MIFAFDIGPEGQARGLEVKSFAAGFSIASAIVKIISTNDRVALAPYRPGVHEDK
jgi:hypothetical protein